MKTFVLILLPCYFYYVYSAPSENLTLRTFNESNQSDDFNVHSILPSSLVENTLSPSRNSRILNENVQDLSNTRQIYIPHTSNDIVNAANLNKHDIPQREIVDLQVPTDANTNRVLLQLPSQQVPLHNTFPVPPRRHYRITLIRNRKPTPPPQLVNTEVEEKTLIYVLVKKPDEMETQLEEFHNNEQNNVKPNPPEVYFIKYKENNDLSKTTSANDQIDANEK